MDEKNRNNERKAKLKLEPHIIVEALGYIELAYKKGLFDLKPYS